MDTPKYPEIEIQLTGLDGNAFAVIGRVREVLRKNGVSKEEIDSFIEEATSGDYNHLLTTCMNTVTVL